MKYRVLKQMPRIAIIYVDGAWHYLQGCSAWTISGCLRKVQKWYRTQCFIESGSFNENISSILIEGTLTK